MVCDACGAELPEIANFCLECGVPTTRQGEGRPAGEQWETAEIGTLEGRGRWLLRFEIFAHVRSPEGGYGVPDPEHESMPNRRQLVDWSSPKVQRGYERLVRPLLAEGWQPTEDRLRFRRLFVRGRALPEDVVSLKD